MLQMGMKCHLLRRKVYSSLWLLEKPWIYFLCEHTNVLVFSIDIFLILPLHKIQKIISVQFTCALAGGWRTCYLALICMLCSLFCTTECEYRNGKWVSNNRRPLYSGFGCKQWLSESWSCRLTQRKDFTYEKFRWQPEACEMPEFEASQFLRRYILHS